MPPKGGGFLFLLNLPVMSVPWRLPTPLRSGDGNVAPNERRRPGLARLVAPPGANVERGTPLSAHPGCVVHPARPFLFPRWVVVFVLVHGFFEYLQALLYALTEKLATLPDAVESDCGEEQHVGTESQ